MTQLLEHVRQRRALLAGNSFHDPRACASRTLSSWGTRLLPAGDSATTIVRRSTAPGDEATPRERVCPGYCAKARTADPAEKVAALRRVLDELDLLR